MPRASQRAESAANSDFLDSFAAVSEAVESGAGLPEVARAASRALGASVAVVDSTASVLAVACASPEDERADLIIAGYGFEANHALLVMACLSPRRVKLSQASNLKTYRLT